ncbi:MAG: hypothetical protein AVDCRST_MAG89-2893, partial [uncultured Gemmatimonadetes bacterium]
TSPHAMPSWRCMCASKRACNAPSSSSRSWAFMARPVGARGCSMG